MNEILNKFQENNAGLIAFISDPRFPKLAAIFVTIHLVMWLAHRHPNHFLTTWIFSWHGPAPIDKEPLSSFTFRTALYATRWLFVFLVLWTILYVAEIPDASFTETPSFAALFFALVIFTGMAALATGFLLVKTLYQKIFQADLYFEVADPDAHGWQFVRLCSEKDEAKKY